MLHILFFVKSVVMSPYSFQVLVICFFYFSSLLLLLIFLRKELSVSLICFFVFPFSTSYISSLIYYFLLCASSSSFLRCKVIFEIFIFKFRLLSYTFSSKQGFTCIPVILIMNNKGRLTSAVFVFIFYISYFSSSVPSIANFLHVWFFVVNHSDSLSLIFCVYFYLPFKWLPCRLQLISSM